MVVCSVSDPIDGAERPPGLSGDKQSSDTPNMPPGLSRSKQYPTEPSGSSGKAAAANGAADAAAASNAMTTAADTLLNSGAAGPPATQDTDKQLRNLRKKIRQADATAKKAAAGQQLTTEEEEKLKKLAIWYALQRIGHSDGMLHAWIWIQHTSSYAMDSQCCFPSIHVLTSQHVYSTALQASINSIA